MSKEILQHLETAIEDFKCARTSHCNLVPDDRSYIKTAYDDIIRRLEAVYKIEQSTFEAQLEEAIKFGWKYARNGAGLDQAIADYKKQRG